MLDPFSDQELAPLQDNSWRLGSVLICLLESLLFRVGQTFGKTFPLSLTFVDAPELYIF
jgi:hypothetical protein